MIWVSIWMKMALTQDMTNDWKTGVRINAQFWEGWMSSTAFVQSSRSNPWWLLCGSLYKSISAKSYGWFWLLALFLKVPEDLIRFCATLHSLHPGYLATQLYPILCDPTGKSLPGPSVHGILQARTLEWVAMPSSRGSSWPRDLSQLSCIVSRFFSVWATREDFLTSSVSSVVRSCPTLCDPMNRSTPGLPVHHWLPEFTQTHVHQVGDAIQPSHPLSSPSPPAFNLSWHRTTAQTPTPRQAAVRLSSTTHLKYQNCQENKHILWVVPLKLKVDPTAPSYFTNLALSQGFKLYPTDPYSDHDWNNDFELPDIMCFSFFSFSFFWKSFQWILEKLRSLAQSRHSATGKGGTALLQSVNR